MGEGGSGAGGGGGAEEGGGGGWFRERGYGIGNVIITILVCYLQQIRERGFEWRASGVIASVQFTIYVWEVGGGGARMRLSQYSVHIIYNLRGEWGSRGEAKGVIVGVLFTIYVWEGRGDGGA